MAFPARDEIHLLLIEEDAIDAALLAQYALLLSLEEHGRHERIHSAADRRRFLITRAAIRIALSHFIPDVAPAEWQFDRNAHGRPRIAGAGADSGLTFNISHAHGLVTIVIARECQLGVDVERMERRIDWLAVAERYFAPAEVNALRALPECEQRARFFDLWTLKEAWVKATGTGLAKSLSQVSFAITGDRIDVSIAEGGESSTLWEFWQLRPSTEHRLALAYARCGSGSCPRPVTTLHVSDMVPLRSLTSRNLAPFRTSQRMYSSTTLEP